MLLHTYNVWRVVAWNGLNTFDFVLYNQLICGLIGGERSERHHYFLIALYTFFNNRPFSLYYHVSANGSVIGAHCEHRCSSALHHVVCDSKSNTCVCDRKYPVAIGLTQCAKGNTQIKIYLIGACFIEIF